MSTTDHFEALFTHVAPSARAFFAGNLCETAQFTECGHLHFLRSGALTLAQAGVPDVFVDEPTLLFFPRAREHRFTGSAKGGADLICATVDPGASIGNPIGEGLPDLVMMPLSRHPALAPICGLLVEEGLSEHEGRQVALDRLFEYLLILIVRHVVSSGAVAGGVLAGLADPRLGRALTAMHAAPRRAWSLEDMAESAGMSRTRFATHFRAIVGRAPMDYLTGWRMTLARQLLSKGKSVKSVAAEVGYGSAAAFSRVFNRVTGQTPRDEAMSRRDNDRA